MQAFGFPLLLVAPALVFDLVMAGWRSRSDWLLAPVLGAAFVGLMVIVHWPFAEFLVRSPLAQNHVFAFDHWAYFNGPGEYRTRFWDLDLADGAWSPAGFMVGLGVAALIGAASARVGLWWGNWMRMVRR